MSEPKCTAASGIELLESSDSNRLNLSKHPTLATRFWAKIKKTPTCWLWTARKNGCGYGSTSIQTAPGRAKDLICSRVSWELANGPIPKGLNVLHKCDNPACVNPNHLFLGTQKDNGADMVKKGRCYNRKVSDAEVLEIRAEVGVSNKFLAWEYGLKESHIQRIRSRKTASHVC